MRVRELLLLSRLFAVLFGVHFLLPIVPAAVGFSSEDVAVYGLWRTVFEAALSIVLVVAFVAVSWWGPTILPPRSRITAASLLIVGLAVWFLVPIGPWSPAMSVVSVTGVSGLLYAAAGEPKRVGTDWVESAYLALMVIIPVVLGMRALFLATGEAHVTIRWVVVNLPLLLLETLVFVVWQTVLWERARARPWEALLPFLLALPILILFAPSLGGFILSALLNWGGNLPIFVPLWLSLSLFIAAVACFFSLWLLLPRHGATNALLFTAVGSVVLAGFHPGMPSAAGLAMCLLFVAIWKDDRSSRPDLHGGYLIGGSSSTDVSSGTGSGGAV